MAGPAGVRRMLVLGVCAAVVCGVLAVTPPWPAVSAAAGTAGTAADPAAPVAGSPIAPADRGVDPELVSDTSTAKPAPLVVPDAGATTVDVAVAGTGVKLLAGAGDATGVKDPAGQGLAVAAGGLPMVVEEVPQAELADAAANAGQPADPKTDGIPSSLNPDAGVEASLTGLVPAVAGAPVGVQSLGLKTAEGLGGRFVAFRLSDTDPTATTDPAPSTSPSASASAAGSGSAAPAATAEPSPSPSESAGVPAPGAEAAAGTEGAQARVVRVTVDTAGFAEAFGADFAGRLRLVVFPACALTSPKEQACVTPVMLPTDVDVPGRTVSAVVPVDTLDAATTNTATDTGSDTAAGTARGTAADGAADGTAGAAADSPSAGAVSGVGGLASAGGGGTVVALMSGASSGSGTFTATDLSATGSWAVGEQSGAFTYSYPVSLPAPAGGAAPSVSWEYDSGSVDGVSLASNGQASWAGRGWSLNESYVERLYRACSTDGHASWQDLCWDTPYSDGHADFGAVVLSLNGQSMELIWDPVAGEYRAGVENGWRVFHRDNGANDDDNDEWWLVKTPDGTEYRFGYGVQNGTGAATHSVATVPVIGDDAGEPCNTLSGSVCQQGYRWMLDSVMDAKENTTTFFYHQDDNYYSYKGSSSNLKVYTQAMLLDHIDYGQQWAAQTTTPPFRVSLERSGRCVDAVADTNPFDGLPSCPAIAGASASAYPDVPLDLACPQAGPCPASNSAPTFFSASMVTGVLVQSRNLTTSGYATISEVRPDYTFPPTYDGTSESLWLNTLQARGNAVSDSGAGASSGNLKVFAVGFDGVLLHNRVDYTSSVPEQNQYRIDTVFNELGGRLDVTYGRGPSGDPCPYGGSLSSGWAPAGGWDHNDRTCYPAFFDPDGDGSISPGFGIFHKYLVDQVVAHDPVGSSPDEVWAWEYSGSPAWAYHNDILNTVGTGNQTWDGWRGYRIVTAYHGAATSPVRTKRITKYFRGMDGDHNADGSDKSVTFTDVYGTTRTDWPQMVGQPVQVVDYNDTTDRVWRRYLYLRDVKVNGPRYHDATLVRSETTDRKEYVAGSSPAVWHEGQVESTYSPLGFVATVWDHGEVGVGGDDTCVDTEYAHNDSATGSIYMIIPDQSLTYHGACISGTMQARTDTWFDNSGGVAANQPTDADPTDVLVYSAAGVAAHTQASFDDYGRVTSTTSPNQVGQTTPKTTLISYTDYPSGRTGQLKQVMTTNPAGQVSYAWFSPWHSGPDTTKDADGLYTNTAYDTLGRPTSQWLPTEGAGATPPTGPASVTASYPGTAGIGETASSAQWTRTSVLQSAGVRVDTVGYVDGFGRDRETQTTSPALVTGTRLVTATTYDDRGLVSGVSDPVNGTGTIGTGLLNPTGSDLKARTSSEYDWAERVNASVRYGKTADDGSGPLIELWRTTIANYSDRIVTTPPTGAKTITYNDYLGRVTTIANYTTSTAHDDTTYGYTYSSAGPTTTITDPNNKVSSYQSDWVGRSAIVVDPNAGKTETGYDADGNPTTITRTSPGSPGTALGSTTTVYDELDRPKTRTTTPPTGAPDAYTSATWTYDTAGNGKGLLKESTSTTRTTIAGSTVDFTITSTVPGYDTRHRPTGSTVKLPDDVTNLKDLSGKTYTQTYGYDSADHLVSIAYPEMANIAAETATTTYTAAGLPTALSLSGSGSIVASTAYLATGQLSTRTYASGMIRGYLWDYQHNAPSEVATYYMNAGTPVYKQRDQYARDAVGNLTQVTDAAQSPAQAQCYSYDGKNRLTAAWTTNTAVTPCSTVPADTATTWNTGTAPYRSAWTFRNDNAIATASTYAISGSTAVKTTRAYAYGDTAHPAAVTSITPSVSGTTSSDTFSWDGAGQAATRQIATGTTLTMGYNPTGQLVTSTGLGGNHRYAYTADGQRVLKITPTTITAYLGDTELTAPVSGGAATGTRYYHQGSATVAARTGSAGPVYLLGDVQGSETLTVTTGTPASATVQRQRYTPYGAPRGSADVLTGIERGWLGQTEDDSTTLTYLNARYYDPQSASFLAPDPLTAPTDPNTHNPYSYAQDNPVSHSDPTGLMLDASIDRGGCNSACVQANNRSLRQQHANEVFAANKAAAEADAKANAFSFKNDVVVVGSKGAANFGAGMVNSVVPGAVPTFQGDIYKWSTLSGEITGYATQALLSGGTATAGRGAVTASKEAVALGERAAAEDVGLSARGLRPLPGTRVRPEGVPDNWRIAGTDSPGGTRYFDPANPGNSVRVMQGNPNSEFANSRTPYVRWQRNGQPLDVNGNKLPSAKDPAAHIPLGDFRFLPELFQ